MSIFILTLSHARATLNGHTQPRSRSKPMEPTNRPYVDPATEPGDAGTDPWADDPASSDPAFGTKEGPLADPAATSREGAAIVGSPADAFLNDDAISAQDDDSDPPAGD